MREDVSEGKKRETHIDDGRGLFIPKDLREFDSQIVLRTPRATIQHFGSQPLDGYYGMIRADQFGDPDEMRDPKNPDLAPDRVRIKPQGEDAVTLTVETDPEIRTDGGREHQPRFDDEPLLATFIGRLGTNYPEWRLVSHTSPAGYRYTMIQWAADDGTFEEGAAGEFVSMVSELNDRNGHTDEEHIDNGGSR